MEKVPMFISQRALLFWAVAILFSSFSQHGVSQNRLNPPKLLGDCYTIFHNNEHFYDYGYMANAGEGAVFAIADGIDGQWCGVATDHIVLDKKYNAKNIGGFINYRASLDDLKRVAIDRCNSIKPVGSPSRCSIYAVGNLVVWQDPGEETSPTHPAETLLPSSQSGDSRSIGDAKEKCADLGFKRGTPKFGECVLKLSR